MKLLFVSLIVLGLIAVSSCDSDKNKKGQYGEGLNSTQSKPYTVVGPIYNYSFRILRVVIDSGSHTPQEIVALINELRKHEYSRDTCAAVDIWDNAKALDIFETRENSKITEEWIRKNSAFMFEHFVASFDTEKAELQMYPHLDPYFYMERGGKKEMQAQRDTLQYADLKMLGLDD
ncbi:hypothetical protein [Larkinella terrae]|uniref:Uncharacterized protein n=1 Tax=Larkinella terrae TaxID=2025311 RepID=A0A7K0EMP1_9BACT|nr:hypothetical protein [Larkinella terrae]MRS63097.1 hypothetical protein [Larkinella terrae]